MVPKKHIRRLTRKDDERMRLQSRKETDALRVNVKKKAGKSGTKPVKSQQGVFAKE